MKIQYLTFSLLSPFVCNWVSGASVEDSNKNEVTERLLPNVIIIYADDLGYGDLQCYGAKNIETPNVNKLADEGLRFTNMHAVAATSTPSRYSLLTGEYAWRKKGTDVAAGNAILQFDWSVGQIMKTLDRLGLTENTLVILSSDNGPVVDDGYDDRAEELLNGHTPSGPLRGYKYSAFEGGTTVPAIVRWPKMIQKKGVSNVLMSQIDWMASLGELIHAHLPKGSAPDSWNRLGNLLGTDNTDRSWVVEFAANHVLSIRTKDWKYIEPNDGPRMITWGPRIETGNDSIPQLYEMKKVNEQENVAAQYPEKLFEMQTLLRKAKLGQ